MSYEVPYHPGMLPGLVTWLDAKAIGDAMPERRIFEDRFIGNGNLADHVADSGQHWIGMHNYGESVTPGGGVQWPGNSNTATDMVKLDAADVRIRFGGVTGGGTWVSWRVADYGGTNDWFPAGFVWGPGFLYYGDQQWGPASRGPNIQVIKFGDIGFGPADDLEIEARGAYHTLRKNGKVVCQFKTVSPLESLTNSNLLVGNFGGGGLRYLTVDALDQPAERMYAGKMIDAWTEPVRRAHARSFHRTYGDQALLGPKYYSKVRGVLPRAASRWSGTTSGWTPGPGAPAELSYDAGQLHISASGPGDLRAYSPASQSFTTEHRAGGVLISHVRARADGTPSTGSAIARSLWVDGHGGTFPDVVSEWGGRGLVLDSNLRSYWAAGGGVSETYMKNGQVGFFSTGGAYLAEAQLQVLMPYDEYPELADKIKPEWRSGANRLVEVATPASPKGGPVFRFTAADLAAYDQMHFPPVKIIPDLLNQRLFRLTMSMYIPASPTGSETTALRFYCHGQNAAGQDLAEADYDQQTDRPEDQPGWRTSTCFLVAPPGTARIAPLVWAVSGPNTYYFADLSVQEIFPADSADVSEGPCVKFEGNSLAWHAPALPRPYTLAGRLLTEEGVTYVAQLPSYGGGPASVSLMGYPGNWHIFSGGDGPTLDGASQGFGSWQTVVVEMNQAPVPSRMWVDGVLVDSKVIGAQEALAGQALLGQQLVGSIREFVVVNRALSDTERDNLTSHLSA